MKHEIKQKMFVHAVKSYNYNEGADHSFKIEMKICDMSEYGHVLLGEVEVSADFDVPDDFNFTQHEIENLKKEKSRIQAEAQMKITNIEEQIQKLQCIEYKVTE